MEKIIGQIVRNSDFQLGEDEIKEKVKHYVDDIKEKRYDFSSSSKEIYSQGKKKRVIYSFNSDSTESVICKYLKKRLDYTFHIKYPSRNKIINSLFSILPVIKDLNDFVIIRADFKSFFDSIIAKYIYVQYLEQSALSRKDKRLFEEYVENFKYCYAGLCLSNVMTEIVCRDFDKNLRAKLEKYGVVYCERYVDDILIILNSYISDEDVKKLIYESISEIFGNCPVRLNERKYRYICKRGISSSQEFDFLGYNFTMNYNTVTKKLSFLFGITEKKRQKYYNRFKKVFCEYAKDHNLELFRQRIKVLSTRVVITKELGRESFQWVTKGVIANYNELRNYLDYLDSNTEQFLKNVYLNLITETEIAMPGFFADSLTGESVYNLFSTLKRNRSTIYDNRIGIKLNDLVSVIKKINPSYYCGTKNYLQIVYEYLELLKIE